jgi:hypothetical protein
MRKSQASIDRWIRQQELRLGIKSLKSRESKPMQPTVTVYPGPLVIERLAHFGADRLIANNSAYDAMCDRTDAMLAEILEAGIPASPRRKSTRVPRVRRVMVND